MGCHSWIYRKITSIPKGDLDKRLQDFYNNKLNTWIGSTSREEYAKNMFEDLPYNLKLDEDDPEKCKYFLETYGTYEKCLKVWDNWHDKLSDIKTRIDNFCSSPVVDPEEYYKIIKNQVFYSEDVKKYKDDYYLRIGGDEIFRCYKYGDSPSPIDNYEKMIEYLKECSEFQICRWIDGVKEFGLTEELERIIRDLYKNDDIFIEFG